MFVAAVLLNARLTFFDIAPLLKMNTVTLRNHISLSIALLVMCVGFFSPDIHNRLTFIFISMATVKDVCLSAFLAWYGRMYKQTNRSRSYFGKIVFIA